MADPSASPTDLPANILEQLKNPTVKRLLAETMMGEAGAEGPRGQQAVEDVILNRAIESGMSIQDVINAPNQFTSMSESLGSRRRLDAMAAAGLAPEMNVIDNPNAAWALPRNVDAFLNPQLQGDLSRRDPTHYHGIPSWAKGTPAETIGRHQFYATGYKGGGPAGAQPTAGGAGNLSEDPRVNEAIGRMLDPNSPQQKALDAITGEEQELLPEQLAAVDAKAAIQSEEGEKLMGYIKKNDELVDRYTKANEALMEDMPDEYKMRQQELAKVSNEPMQPSRVLGQWLPMLAVLGGAFLGADSAGVLNAAASAAEAARGHDDKAAEQAHQMFQDKLTTVMDKASLLHEEMSEAIANNRNSSQDMMTAMGLIAAKYDVPSLKQAVLHGSAQDIIGQNDGLLKTLSTLSMFQRNMYTGQLTQLKMQQIEQQLAGGGQLDSGSLAYAAEMYRLKGTLPALGMGQSAVAARQAIIDEANKLSSGGETDATALMGASDASRDATGQVDFKAVSGAVQALGKLRGQIQQFEGTAQKEADLTLDKAQKGVAGGVPMFNRWIQAGRKALEGDPAVTEFDSAITTFKNEYARVMSTGGAGMGGATSDAARNEADSLINDAQNMEQLKGNIATMKQSMKNRMDAINEAYNSQQSMLPGVNAPPGAPTTPGGQPTQAGQPAAQPASQGVGPREFNQKTFATQVAQARDAIAGGQLGWTMDQAHKAFKTEYPWMSDHTIDLALSGH